MSVCVIARNCIRPGGAIRDTEKTRLCIDPCDFHTNMEEQKETGVTDRGTHVDEEFKTGNFLFPLL